MLDLGPAAARVAALLQNVRDDQLDAPTPSGTFTVGDVVDHIGTVARVWAAKGAKQEPAGGAGGRPPAPSRANLEPEWRERIAADLDRMAAVWREPSAWEGETTAGGMTLPASVAGAIALDEMVVHGWDIAAATGQPYQPSDEDIAAAIEFASTFEAPRNGSLFGPMVDVPADAPAIDQLLGITGRDPNWTPR